MLPHKLRAIFVFFKRVISKIEIERNEYLDPYDLDPSIFDTFNLSDYPDETKPDIPRSDTSATKSYQTDDDFRRANSFLSSFLVFKSK